jgi:hypothetical protein
MMAISEVVAGDAAAEGGRFERVYVTYQQRRRPSTTNGVGR